MEEYLINYLKVSTNDCLVKKYVDLFKVELDWFIYNYGEHVSSSYKRDCKLSLKSRLYRQLQIINTLLNKPINSKVHSNVLSSVYFADSQLLLSLGYNPISSIFQPVGLKNILGDREAIKLLGYKRDAISKGIFRELHNPEFYSHLESYKKILLKQSREYNFAALFLYTDQYFESKYLIDIFKTIQKPSFVFSHGLPAIYSLEVDNRADFLMVWGDKIKQNYINAGFDKNKIYVTGSSKYLRIDKRCKLRNTLDDVLVVPCSSLSVHQHEWGTPVLIDRSMIILYLYEIQSVLKKVGISHARFRPHPSIDKDWVYTFLDHNFYEIDKEHLVTSLERSSLVIGATSTLFLETLMNGVNYLIYEPQNKGQTRLREPAVPPFDGTEHDIEIANSTDELEYMLRYKYQTNLNVLDGYIRPLDLSILKDIIR